jgi:hypothetical protein
VIGLCSGAYHAFHATLADGRIERQVLVNFPLFHWSTGVSIELVDLTTLTEREILSRLTRKFKSGLLALGRRKQRTDWLTRRRWVSERVRALVSCFAGSIVQKGSYGRKTTCASCKDTFPLRRERQKCHRAKPGVWCEQATAGGYNPDRQWS